MVEACARFLGEALQPDNCVGILHLADTHSLTSLKAHVQSYIIQKFALVVAHEEFQELSEDVLVGLLQHDDLAVSEEELVFEVTMRWVRAHEAERVPALPRVLRHVRLPMLDPCFFVDMVEGDPLIRGCEGLFPLLQEARAYHLSGNEVWLLFTPLIHDKKISHLLTHLSLVNLATLVDFYT